MWRRTRRCAAILAGLSLAVPARSADGPRVRHDGVGCVLAGVHPRLRACFPPGMETGRAQVQFRADGSGPWYGVDMKADGACRSAVLPIPRRETAALDYFIEVADAAAGLVREPASAPAQSFAPRVVETASTCGAGLTVAPSVPQAPVVVTVARDPDGRPIPAALAPSAEARATLAGFRAEGVRMASTGLPPGRTARGPVLSSSSGGGASKAIVIAGGLAAAGALAALVAAGNKAEASPTDAASTTPLTGRWLGSADSGEGLTLLLDTGGTICTYTWDVTADLVQSEASLGGSATVISRRATCPFDTILTFPPPFSGPATSVPIHGSASGGEVTFQAGTTTLTGTYTASLLVASGSLAGVGSGGRATYTWRQTKQ